MAIDRLIHYFHGEAADQPVRPAARNIIGGTPQQIVELLDGLAEGPKTAPEIRRTRDDYRAKRKRSHEVIREIQQRSKRHR